MKKQILLWSVITLMSAALSAQDVFINEFTYDYEGQESVEYIEIFGPAETDLTGWSIWLYDGEKKLPYHNEKLVTNLGNDCEVEGKKYGLASVLFEGGVLENGPADGIALVDKEGKVIQFISYEGTLTPEEGPAKGMTSTDVGVVQDDSTPKEESIQVTEGKYVLAPNTLKECNKGQSAGVESSSCDILPDCEQAITELVTGIIESNGSGGSGEDCKQWDGQCNTQGFINRKGSVGIGTFASETSRLTVVGGSAMDGISVESESAGIITQGDIFGIVAATKNGSAIWATAEEGGIAGEFSGDVEVNQGDVEVNKGLLAIKPAAENALIVQNGDKFSFRLDKNGKVEAGEVEVKMAPFPDYVFAQNYNLMSLEDLAAFIQQNQHLPEIPSAAEVDENGIGLGQLAILQMKKIEELTLYVLQLNEELQLLKETQIEIKKSNK